MGLLALALAPIAFIFTYVYLMDRHEREPLIYLIVSFVLGILTAFPVVYIGEKIQMLTGVSEHSAPLELLVYAFVVVALTEEGMKYLVLRLYNYPQKEFDEPYDGIMYGVAVSLGFASIENVLYVFGSTGTEIETGLVRMFTAVPAHAMFGVMMGYHVGKAKFLTTSMRTWEHFIGLGTAVLFHGLYDYFLFLGQAYFIPLAIFILIFGVRLAGKAIDEHQENSPHKEEGL